MATDEMGMAALQTQLTEANGRIDTLQKRLDTLASADNVPSARLEQLDKAVSLLGAILREAKAETFRTDVSGLMNLVQPTLQPLRARMAGADAPETAPAKAKE